MPTRTAAVPSPPSEPPHLEWRSLLDVMPDIAYMLDAEGRLVRWNERMESITGRSQEELLGIRADALFLESDQEAVRQAIGEVLRDGTGEVEARILTSNEPLYLEINGRTVLNEEGEIVGLTGTGRDISKQKSAEEALRQSQRRISLLHRVTREVLIAEDREAMADAALDGLARLLPYSVARLVLFDHEAEEALVVAERPREATDSTVPLDQLLSETLSPWTVRRVRASDDVPELPVESDEQDVLRATLTAGERIIGLLSLGVADGRRFGTEDGSLLQEVANVLAVAVERLKYEHHLIAEKERAQEVSETKSRLLSNMSHEIRTPLSTIIGYAEVLEEETKGHLREFALLIQQGGRRLLTTLNSMLDLATLQHDRHQVQFEQIDVRVEVEEIAGLYRQRAQRQGLQFAVELPQRAVHAEVDAHALQRILDNLIGNALKFTSEGEVRICLQSRGDELTITVSDTGIGIDGAFLPTMFEEFTQESIGLTRTHEGSGLGLAITKRLIELMHGEICVESVKGEGTSFHITLPLRQPAPEETPSV